MTRNRKIILASLAAVSLLGLCGVAFLASGRKTVLPVPPSGQSTIAGVPTATDRRLRRLKDIPLALVPGAATPAIKRPLPTPIPQSATGVQPLNPTAAAIPAIPLASPSSPKPPASPYVTPLANLSPNPSRAAYEALIIAPAALHVTTGADRKLYGPQFVMSAAADLRGNIWFGSEDQGIWRYTPSTQTWKQFTTQDGLGDDNGYAIAVDKLGRIWAGHLNHGVSVYAENKDGVGRWQCYEVVAALSRPDTLAGPLGERVFAIATNPKDGNVWISTNVGLARYGSAGVPTRSLHKR